MIFTINGLKTETISLFSQNMIFIIIVLFFGISDSSSDETNAFTNETDSMQRNEINSTVVTIETKFKTTSTEKDIITETSIDVTPQTPPKRTTQDFKLSTTDTSNKFFTVCEKCFCDINPEVCDMNCCCDWACTENDMKVFSACDDLIFPISHRYCYKRNIFYKINTDYEITKIPSHNLFCAVPSEVKQQKCLTKHKHLESLKEQKMLAMNRRYFDLPSNDELVLHSHLWKVGDAVIIQMDNGEYRYLGIPAPLFGVCNGMQRAKYMLSQSISCPQYMSSVDCTRNEIFSGTEYSKIQGLQQDFNINICLPSASCQLLSNISSINLPEPMYNITTNKCHNVLKDLNYLIVHDGINGITEINFTLIFTNVTVDTKFHQTFSVSYVKNDDIKTSSQQKTYNILGYQQGDPITTRDEASSYEFYVHISDAYNDCNSEHMVGFGTNIASSCTLNVNIGENSTSPCDIMGKSTKELFITNTKFKYISQHRKSNIMSINDWIPLLDEYESNGNNNHDVKDQFLTDGKYCTNTIMSSHVIILYVLTGHRSNPQAKIIGATRKLKSGGVIHFHQSDLLSVHVVTAVTFLDATTAS